MLLSNNCIEREERESYHVYVFVEFTPLFTTPLPPKTNTQQQQQNKKEKKTYDNKPLVRKQLLGKGST